MPADVNLHSECPNGKGTLGGGGRYSCSHLQKKLLYMDHLIYSSEVDIIPKV